ncbi:hypothetical protein [Nocardia sp. NPDC057030]|uniref:hypothetical protein n=1 Tax=unclassified Nocardia TaxID=2637762 RepID=UPI0036293D90
MHVPHQGPVRSQGVQVGNDNLQFNLFKGAHRALLIAATAVVLVAVFVSTYLLWPADPQPKLELAKLAVDDPADISADRHIAGEQPDMVDAKQKVKASAVDITLKNNGNAPAVILGAKVDILYAEQMQNCPHSGGEVSVSANYDLRLPTPLPPRPFGIEREMRFEVKGGSTDRMTLTIGPDRQTLSSSIPYLFAAHIRLVQDTGAVLDVGAVALAAMPGQASSNLNGSDVQEPQCIANNAQIVRTLFETQAVPAPELIELRRRYDELTTPDSGPATRVCTRESAPGLESVCATYTRQAIVTEIKLTDPPTPGLTKLAVLVSPSKGNRSYRVSTPYADFGTGPRWSAAPSTEGSSDENIRRSRSEFAVSTNTLTIEIIPSVKFLDTHLGIYVELGDAITSKQFVVKSRLPASGEISVDRGN